MTDIQAIREREQKATKGPWITTKTPNSVSVASHSEHNRIYISLRDPVCLPETFKRQKDDADFIAHSRQDIPDLLALVYRAREIIERMIGWIPIDYDMQAQNEEGVVRHVAEQWLQETKP